MFTLAAATVCTMRRVLHTEDDASCRHCHVRESCPAQESRSAAAHGHSNLLNGPAPAAARTAPTPGTGSAHPAMQWEPIEGRDGAWTARHLLTDGECTELIERAEGAGIRSTLDVAGVTDLRSCLRVEMDLPELAATLWSRLRGAVPQEVDIHPGAVLPPGVPNQRDLHGVWRAVGVNTRFRIVLYPGTGYFGPHRDGDYVANPNLRSLITINGYMNELTAGVGGATRFLEEDQELHRDETGRFAPQPGSVTHSIVPERGMAVCFFHALLHDGEPLKENAPPKWLFRTEVMYARDSGTETQYTDAEVLARQLLKQAEDAEAVDAMAAMQLYRRAYKLDPGLEAATRAFAS
jgi:hypothetical protein